MTMEPVDWSRYKALPDWTDQLGQWLNSQTPERQHTLLKGMDDVDMDPDKRNMWLDKIMFDEAVVDADIASASTPAAFREAAERGDLEAMQKFLAERIRNQLAGKEWI